MFITKNKKTFRVEMSEMEEKDYAKRMAKGMFAAEKKSQAKANFISSLAICPDCHITCTPTGFCIWCGKDCSHLIKDKSKVVRIPRYM